MEKYGSQTCHKLQYNTAHAHCMLDNYGYRHTHTHTHTHSEYVILIIFKRQWSRERVSLLYIHCLSCSCLTVYRHILGTVCSVITNGMFICDEHKAPPNYSARYSCYEEHTRGHWTNFNLTGFNSR